MALANIVLNDAASPNPFVHTFVGIADGNRAVYVNEDSETLKGQEVLRYNVDRVSSSANTTKPNVASVSLYVPKEVETADGAFTVSHGSSYVTTCNFAQKATFAERLDGITMHINALIALKDDIVNLRAKL